MKEFRLGDIAYTSQGTIKHIANQNFRKFIDPFFVEVTAVYSDRNTVDVIAPSKATYRNIPIIMQNGGLIDNEVHGTLDLPSIGDTVLLLFIFGNLPVVLGKAYPYAKNAFQSGQTPVNSSNKAYTKKLLEAQKENTYRKIFKSGTTIEVQDDGSVVLETPSGKLFTINEDTGVVTISGDTTSIEIDDDNSKITLTAGGCTTVMDDSAGKTTINGNLEVLV